MTVRELIESVDFYEMWPVFCRIYLSSYTSEEKSFLRNNYKKWFDEAMSAPIDAAPDGHAILIKGTRKSDDSDDFEMIAGINYCTTDKTTQSLEFGDLCEIANIPVSDKSLEEYGKEVCLACILQELTCCYFYRDDILNGYFSAEE